MLVVQKSGRSGRIENLVTEIASQEAQLEQVQKVYNEDIAEFKKRKLTKNSQEWKSAERAFDMATRKIKSLIEKLNSCLSLPVNSLVNHEDYGQGQLQGFLIDDRGVVMASVDFEERGAMDVAPHSLKVVTGDENPSELPQSIQNFLERNTEETAVESISVQQESLQTWADKVGQAYRENLTLVETEIAGSSDEDECDRICAEINELGAKFEFEVGRRLLRLTEIFKPSTEYPTLDSYCQAKLNQKFSETKRKELVHAAKVMEALPEAPITSLRQTKPLYKMLNSGVEPELIQEIVGVAMTTPSGLTGDSIENVAVERGLLPKKEPKQPKSTKQETVAQGQSLGLSGSESQQMPSIEPNADVPPEGLPLSLSECLTHLEVNDFIRTRQSEAIAQFVAMNWEERFELRQLTQNTIDSQLLGNATEVQCRQVIPLLDLDKDSKIEWLSAELVRLRQENDELKLQLSGKSKPISTRTDEWYTPPEYVEMAREVMGGIDLDPASNELAQSWIKAAKYYTKEDDGLRQEWAGNVWCNPPYGRAVEDWLIDAINRYENSDIQSSILLLNRTGAAWYKQAIKGVTAICEVHRRIAFIDENGNRQDSPRYYNDFLYLGKNPEKFIEVFSGIGDVRLIQSGQQDIAEAA